MDYNGVLLLVKDTPGMTMSAKYEQVVGEALYSTMPTGTLDIMLMNTPGTLRQLEKIVSDLYAIARRQAEINSRQKVRVTVLLDGHDIEYGRPQKWEVIAAGAPELPLTLDFRRLIPPGNPMILGVPVVLLKMDDDFLYTSTAPTPSNRSTKSLDAISEDLESLNLDQASHPVVCLGGTFDHLHDGHKILLTVAGYIALEKLIVGVTGPELLKNKKYAEAMESYDVRKETVEGFLSYVFPSLQVEAVMISDIYGPTAHIPEIQALVLSKETQSGGNSVNELRRSKGFPELKVFAIDVVGGKDSNEQNNWEGKMSSTEYRRLELEAREKEREKEKL